MCLVFPPAQWCKTSWSQICTWPPAR
jgi:hypothetical protein